MDWYGPGGKQSVDLYGPRAGSDLLGCSAWTEEGAEASPPPSDIPSSATPRSKAPPLRGCVAGAGSGEPYEEDLADAEQGVDPGVEFSAEPISAPVPPLLRTTAGCWCCEPSSSPSPFIVIVPGGGVVAPPPLCGARKGGEPPPFPGPLRGRTFDVVVIIARRPPPPCSREGRTPDRGQASDQRVNVCVNGRIGSDPNPSCP